MRDLQDSHKLTPAQQAAAADRVKLIKKLHNELWTILMQSEALIGALKTTVADFLSSQIQRAVGSPTWTWIGSGTPPTAPLAYLGELSHKCYQDFIDPKDPWGRLTVPTSVPCAHPTAKAYWEYTDGPPPPSPTGSSSSDDEQSQDNEPSDTLPSTPPRLAEHACPACGSPVFSPSTEELLRTRHIGDAAIVGKELEYGQPEPEPEPEP